MKALMYRGPGKISYENIPDSTLPDEYGAVVKTTTCSICGTDLHAYHTDMGAIDYCIGHEAVGEIVEVGSEVRNFAVGDRVLIPASIGCGKCAPCLAGNVILCQTYESMRAYGGGDPTLPGCQAEAVAVTVADRNLFHLPDELSDEIGIMLTDNIATAWYCARRGRVEPGKTVAIIGMGSVGLQTVLAARAMGADTIYGLDLLADRRSDAEGYGAINLGDGDSLELVREATKGKGVDIVLDASGGTITTPLAIRLAARGGRVSQIAVSEQPDVPFPVLEAMFKNLEFHVGVCSVQAEVPHLLSALSSGRMDPSKLASIVTHRMPMSQGAEAYSLFNAQAVGMKKVVLDPTG